MNEDLTTEEKNEGLIIAIVKGLTCNGVKEWQKVTLKNGKEMAIRFGGSMVIQAWNFIKYISRLYAWSPVKLA